MTGRFDALEPATEAPRDVRNHRSSHTNRSRGALAILREAVRLHRARVVAAALLAVAGAGTSLAAPMLVRQVIVEIGVGRSPVVAAATLAVLVLAGAAAAGLSSYLLGSVGERGIASVRIRIVTHVLHLPLLNVRRIGGGDLAARAVADTAHLRSLIDVGVTAIPVSALIVVVSIALMVFLDWLLLVVVVVTFALAAVAIRSLLRTVRRGNAAQQSALGRLTDAFVAALGSLVAIKTLRAERLTARPIAAHARSAAEAAVSSLRAQASITPIVGLSQQVAIIAVLATSGARLASGDLRPADFVAFLMYLFQLVTPLMTIASGMARVQAGASAAGRIDEVLHNRVEPPGPAAKPAHQPQATVLELQSVVAGYGSREVLRGVSLGIQARSLTALIGASGAGKSTILNVCEQFLVPQHGRVLLHGCDLRRWPLAAARARMAYVDQGCTLLVDTIRQNLVLGCAEPPSDEDLLAALRVVDMAEAVAHLPEGLDTWLGKGSDMSGGQRQRLAIARTLLSDAEVVLLDEPTSQLDGINEQRLLDILQRLVRDRAVVVATHHPGIVMRADRVVLLSNGSVLATGRPDQLIVACPEYRQLFGVQAPGSGSELGDRLAHAHRAT